MLSGASWYQGMPGRGQQPLLNPLAWRESGGSRGVGLWENAVHRSLKLCAFPLTGHGATTFACSAPQLTCVCVCVRVWSAHAPPLCHRPCIFFYPRDQRVSKTPSPNYFPREKNKDREKISRQDIINERTLERERKKEKIENELPP